MVTNFVINTTNAITVKYMVCMTTQMLQVGFYHWELKITKYDVFAERAIKDIRIIEKAKKKKV